MTARPSFIAHRGSSFLAPENTLAALKLGWRETTMCEIDMRLTADGRLVVIHDASTKRTTGADLCVARTRWRDLRKLDAGAWKGAEWMGEKLPLLEEALAAMPIGKRLLIEVKAGTKAVPELVRVIRTSGKEKRVAVHSFIFATCVATKRALPDLPVYLLIASNKEAETKRWSPTLADVRAKVTRAGLDGVGTNLTPLLSVKAVERMHAAGLRVNVWTVDQVAEAKKLRAMQVDGIITNRPGWLKKQVF